MTTVADDQFDFVHVSDCHIGRVLANSLYASKGRALVGTGAAQPAHDIALCKAFALALEDVRVFSGVPDDVAVPVVMSGDLTASGDASEFAVAHLRGVN